MSKITAVTLTRSACFGTCSVYEVTLRRRGWASWHGEMFIDRIGEHRGKVDPDDFERVAGFIERCGFFTWKPEYSPTFNITDKPTYMLVVRRGTETKTVTQYATDEPPDFAVLAALVDAVADNMKWTLVPAG